MATARTVIDEEDVPHPGLHVKVRVRCKIDYRRHDKYGPSHWVTYAEPVSKPLIIPCPDSWPWPHMEEWVFGPMEGDEDLYDYIAKQDKETYDKIRRYEDDITDPKTEVKLYFEVYPDDGELQWANGDGTPYDIRPLEAGRIRGLLGDSMSYLSDHRPHPDLHVAVRLRFYGLKPNETVYDLTRHLTGTVVIHVPENCPFDQITEWMHNRDISEGPIKWWREFQDQSPAEARRVEFQLGLQIGVGVVGVVGYEHSDGTPYDIRLFLRDRVSGLLDTEESNMSNARKVIDEFTGVAGIPGRDMGPAPVITPPPPVRKPVHPPTTNPPSTKPGVRPWRPHIRPGVNPRPKMRFRAKAVIDLIVENELPSWVRVTLPFAGTTVHTTIRVQPGVTWRELRQWSTDFTKVYGTGPIGVMDDEVASNIRERVSNVARVRDVAAGVGLNWPMAKFEWFDKDMNPFDLRPLEGGFVRDLL